MMMMDLILSEFIIYRIDKLSEIPKRVNHSLKRISIYLIMKLYWRWGLG